jgi:hypothetical protein
MAALGLQVSTDATTQSVLEKLLALWETYFREGRYQDAARVAQKALALVPGNLAAEIALELARKHCGDAPAPMVSGNACSGGFGLVGRIVLNERNFSVCTPPRPTVVQVPCSPPRVTLMDLQYRPWGFVSGLTPCSGFTPDATATARPPCAQGFINSFTPCPGFTLEPTGTARPTWRPAPPANCVSSTVPSPCCANVVQTTAATIPAMQAAPVRDEIRVTATGKRVHVVSPAVDGRCNRMTSVNRNGRVVLEGQVSLTVHMGGRSMHVVADRVIVGLTDGSFEIESPPSLIPTAVFSEPVLRHVQPAWWAAPVPMDEGPKTKPTRAVIGPGIPSCGAVMPVPKP